MFAFAIGLVFLVNPHNSVLVAEPAFRFRDFASGFHREPVEYRFKLELVPPVADKLGELSVGETVIQAEVVRVTLAAVHLFLGHIVFEAILHQCSGPAACRRSAELAFQPFVGLGLELAVGRHFATIVLE